MHMKLRIAVSVGEFFVGRLVFRPLSDPSLCADNLAQPMTITTFFTSWHTLIARAQKLASILLPRAECTSSFFMRESIILSNIVGAQVVSFWTSNLVVLPL